MTSSRRQPRSWPRNAFFVLALLALALKVIVPPGFMLSDDRGAAPSIVICTGHGALQLEGTGDQKAPPAKSKADAPCAFAANAAPLAPEFKILVAGPRRIVAQRANVIPAQTTPGRGLAAPPPPATGPPALSI